MKPAAVPREPLLLYGSPATKGKLTGAAQLAGLLSALVLVVLPVFVPIATPLWLGIVCSLGTLAVMLALLAVRVVLPDASCSFCRKSRRDVKRLVAGPGVSICDECVGLCAQVITEEAQSKEPEQWSLATLSMLPLRCPRAISAPMFAACVCTDGKVRDRVVTEAFRLGNEPAIVALLEAVPESDRTNTDWINLGAALEGVGRAHDAESAARHATDPMNEPWVLNNVACARLAGGESDPIALQKLVEDVLRGRQLLEARGAGFESIKANLCGTLAELHRRLGQPEKSAPLLVEAEQRGGLNSWRLITAARLALAAGQTDEARRKLEQATSLAHPESTDALRARELLQSASP